jgi:hypothetical protein
VWAADVAGRRQPLRQKNLLTDDEKKIDGPAPSVAAPLGGTGGPCPNFYFVTFSAKLVFFSR